MEDILLTSKRPGKTTITKWDQIRIARAEAKREMRRKKKLANPF